MALDQHKKLLFAVILNEPAQEIAQPETGSAEVLLAHDRLS